MKYYILFIATSLLIAFNVNGQAPDKFNYQGIARDNAGAPMVNQELGLQISILDGENAEYVETHTTTTNAFGLYSLAIGGGTPLTGTMADVAWGSGNKSIKIEIDPDGGSNYSDLGTTELLSVPYALYALESETGVQGPQGPQGETGPEGPPGSQGNTGVQGLQGIAGQDGSPGETGSTGPQGETGPIGETGVTGIQGPQGDIGPQGPQGPQGDVGAAGNSGPIGQQGPIGNTGPQGSQGVAGQDGSPGETGPPGATGAIGPQGPQGNIGPQGPAGTTGSINGVTAGGDLSGTYPNPSIKSNGVTTSKIANGAVTAAKLHSMGATNGQVLKYNGSDWVPSAANSSGWALSGNSVNSSDFIGTTNSQTLRFKQNNVNAGFINPDNTAFGHKALNANTSGEGNAAFGDSSLYLNTNGWGNTAFGHTALKNNTTGSHNTAIGTNARASSGNLNYATAIGANAVVSQSNSLILGSIADESGSDYVPPINVGIGTSSPSARLHVVGSTFLEGTTEIKSWGSITYPMFTLKHDGFSIGAAYATMSFKNSNPGSWNIAAAMETTNQSSLFKINYNTGSDDGSDILQISGQGKVGINYSPVNISIYDGVLAIKSPTGSDNLSLINSSESSKWGFYVGTSMQLYYNESLKGTFSQTSGAYSTTSDSRLKENITPVTSLLDKVQDIKIMSYTYIADKKQEPQIGYIAQELEKQFPEFVTPPNPDDERETYYTVNYAGMSVVAIKAIQEQQEIIKNQAKEIEAMQSLLQKMERRLDKLEK